MNNVIGIVAATAMVFSKHVTSYELLIVGRYLIGPALLLFYSPAPAPTPAPAPASNHATAPCPLPSVPCLLPSALSTLPNLFIYQARESIARSQQGF